jgi:large subunit ribosomal protein L4
MTKAEIKTSTLTRIGAQELADIKVQPTALRQVIIGMQSNLRQSTADTKRRGEVSGGGKKPWRQKGTGRARTGSSRNPLWRGGGITFGPTNEANFNKSIPVRLKRQALMMALKLKADKESLMQVNFDKPVTTVKEVKAQAPELFTLRSALVVVTDAVTARAMRNVSNLTPVSLNRVNALMIVSAYNVVFVGDTYTQLLNRANQDA